MRNVLTHKQLTICAKTLRQQSELCHQIIVDKQAALRDLEAIEPKTESDLHKMSFLEDDVVRYMDEETALLALADMIDDTPHVINIRTDISY